MNLDILNNEFILIKPHHLLDYLYDLAIDYDHEGEVNVYGSYNGVLCQAFFQGLIKRIKFTPYIDDICKPCKNIVNGRCIDTFDDTTTKLYGQRYKNEFNYELDIKLNSALPNLFKFNEAQNMLDILKEMQKVITEDIVNLYLWKRPDRYKKTLEGIAKAIEIYNE
ncbi:MAG: hypothetical protein MJ248_03750 [Bacilli bacterium]|nr:hypothetical protein [Bacilli bacterium]